MRFTFKNRDGLELVGNLHRSKTDIKAYALFAHCFTCTKNILAASTITKD